MSKPGDFEVSLSAKHRRLLKINRFKKIIIKLQERKKYLKGRDFTEFIFTFCFDLAF